MPELPDVELYKRYLDEHALRQRIEHVAVGDARILGDLSARAFAATLARQPLRGVAPPRQASSGPARARRLADPALRHDRQSRPFPQGRGRSAVRPGALRLRGRRSPRLRQPPHARPGRPDRGRRRLHPRGRARPRRSRSGIRSGRVHGRSFGPPPRRQVGADGPGADRRNRQHLRRRDPVPGAPAPEDSR